MNNDQMNRGKGMNEGMDDNDNLMNQQNNENQNVHSTTNPGNERMGADQGTGRSYDYGTPGSEPDNMNEQQNVSNDRQQGTSNNSGGTSDMGNNALTSGSRSDSRAGTGSGLNTKRSITGSDFDGQNKAL